MTKMSLSRTGWFVLCRGALFCLSAALGYCMPAESAPVALTPPMGWNSWNTFKKNIDEKLVHQAANALVSSGMQAAGYKYVTIDDGWQLATRNGNGDLQYDPQKFPEGMKALGDYIHSKGLLFGIYTSAGVKTCMRYEGSYDHELQDVQRFASWGVDFVKVDWCCTHPKHLADKNRSCPANDAQDYGTTGQKELYQRWSSAISHVRRPIVLSICEWGTGKPWLWAPKVGNMWRTTEDILPCRDCKKSWWGLGWRPILDQQAGLARYAGPGHWNDPDMLIVGVDGLSTLDARAHFSFWCLLAAPLIAGNDPRSMSPETHRILTNKEAIAVDQDPLGIEGRRIRENQSTEVWVKPLSHGAWAVILFNRSNLRHTIAFQHSDADMPKDARYAIRDVWTGKQWDESAAGFSKDVPPQDILFVVLTPQSTPKGD